MKGVHTYIRHLYDFVYILRSFVYSQYIYFSFISFRIMYITGCSPLAEIWNTIHFHIFRSCFNILDLPFPFYKLYEVNSKTKVPVRSNFSKSTGDSISSKAYPRNANEKSLWLKMYTHLPRQWACMRLARQIQAKRKTSLSNSIR